MSSENAPQYVEMAADCSERADEAGFEKLAMVAELFGGNNVEGTEFKPELDDATRMARLEVIDDFLAGATAEGLAAFRVELRKWAAADQPPDELWETATGPAERNLYHQMVVDILHEMADAAPIM